MTTTSESVLSRTVDISFLSVRIIVAAVAVLAALLLRLLDLDRWPLTAGEAAIALEARNLVEGLSVPDGMLGQPFVIEWTALFMFLGDTDGAVGRLSMATAGLALVLLILLLYRWFGAVSALAAGILAATSPTLIATSRRIDGGVLLVVLGLALLIALLMSRDRVGFGWPVVAGMASGLLLLSGALSIPALLLAILAFVLVARPQSIAPWDRFAAGCISFLITVILFGTVLLTKPEALPESLGEMFSQLWNDHLLEAGQHWYLPLFNLVANEPLLIVLSVIAVVAGRNARLVVGLGIWSLAALALMSVLVGDGVTAYGLTVLPLVILAAFGVQVILGRLAEIGQNRWQAAGFALVIILLFLAFLSVAGLASNDDPTRSNGETFIRFLLVLGIVIVPLGYLLLRLGRTLPGKQLLLLLSAVVLIFSAITLRSAVLTTTERLGDPEELLSLGISGQDLPIVVEQINKVSRDLTANERTSQDATGGHGLTIAVDERVEQPFAWYFRDYPDFLVFDPATEPVPPGTEVLIVESSPGEDAEFPGLTGGEFVYGWTTPKLYNSPDWGNILGGIVDPDGWRSFGDFLMNRGLAKQPVAENFKMVAVPAVSERLFAASGPYNLNDLAGAGQASGQFNQPRGVAIDENGAIYVVDAGNLRVQKFAPDGEFLLAFGDDPNLAGGLARFEGGGAGPGGITIVSDGNIYVADTWNHMIQVYSPEGEYVRSWGTFYDATDDPELAAGNPGAFYGPRGIAAHEGLIYVTDTGNERVQVFTEEGEFVRMFGLPGEALGELKEPVGIAVTPDGTLLVADSHNQRIARFTLEGEPIDFWPVPAWGTFEYYEPYIAVGPDGNVYASSSQTGEIAVFSPEGEELGIITDLNISRPYAIAVTPDGSQLLVTDGIGNTVIRVSSTPV